MSGLAQADVSRLAKMLRLLGSASVGERAAAALKVHEFVTSRQLDWEALLAPPEAPPAVVSVSVGGREAENAYAAQAAASARAQAMAAQMQANAYTPYPYPGPSAQANAQAAAAAQAQQDAIYAALNAQATQARRYGPSAPPQGPSRGSARHADGSTTSHGYPGSVSPTPRTWRNAAGECLQHPERLRGDREIDFVQGLLTKVRAGPTDKQETWLRDICARVGVEAW